MSAKTPVCDKHGWGVMDDTVATVVDIDLARALEAHCEAMKEEARQAGIDVESSAFEAYRIWKREQLGGK